MARTEQVADGLVVKQKEQGSNVLLPNGSVNKDKLSDDVAFGLIPVGAVIPIMTHLTGSFSPGVSGAVVDGLMLCDGATIPSGNTLQGVTPNLSNDAYLRGSTSSGATGGSNSKNLNTPQLPSHGHPLTISSDSAPHDHPASSGNSDAPHDHPASSSTENAPHDHPASSSTENAPHSHPASTGTANAPHGHQASPNGDNNVAHAHNTYGGVGASFAPFGGSAVEAIIAQGDYYGFKYGGIGQPGLATGGNSVGHTHPAGNVPSGNAPHSHPASTAANNAPHSHTITVGTDNAPHSHTITVSAANAPHSHPVTVNLANAPHSHPGSSIGTTGAGDSINFEPNYVSCVYVIRVR